MFWAMIASIAFRSGGACRIDAFLLSDAVTEADDKRGAPMLKNRTDILRVMQWACLSGTIAALCGWASAANADELQAFRNVGDGYRAVKVITSYELHPETKTMDLTAKEPNDPSFSRDLMASLATRTVHEICANRTLRPGWTIRIFLPGESSPASLCRTGAPGGHMQRQGNLTGLSDG